MSYRYFAVDENFPTDLLPEDQGLIITNSFHADIIRPSAEFKLNLARRKNTMLRIARQVVQQLLVIIGTI